MIARTHRHAQMCARAHTHIYTHTHAHTLTLTHKHICFCIQIYISFSSLLSVLIADWIRPVRSQLFVLALLVGSVSILPSSPWQRRSEVHSSQHIPGGGQVQPSWSAVCHCTTHGQCHIAQHTVSATLHSTQSLPQSMPHCTAHSQCHIAQHTVTVTLHSHCHVAQHSVSATLHSTRSLSHCTSSLPHCTSLGEHHIAQHVVSATLHNTWSVPHCTAHW